MAGKHPVEIPPPSPSSSSEEGNPSSEEEQEEEEEDKVNNTNAGKDDEEDADETEEEEDSDENSSSEEEQEEEKVEDGMEEDKVYNAIACKDDEDDDDETEEEEEEGSDSDSDSESESDLLSPSPSAYKLQPVSPPLLPTSEDGKAAGRKNVKAETLKIEANGEAGGEKNEADGRVKRKIDVDADKNMWEKYPLLDASLNELESELRPGGALFLRRNFGLIGKSSMDELEREWKKLKQDEVKLFSRRNALIAKQAGLFLDRL